LEDDERRVDNKDEEEGRIDRGVGQKEEGIGEGDEEEEEEKGFGSCVLSLEYIFDNSESKNDCLFLFPFLILLMEDLER
jgi:hypothetical protein